MKNIFVLFVLLSSSYVTIAQVPAAAQQAPKGSAKISGVLLDSTTNKPVDFASIALINPTTNKPLDGTMADAVGKFTIPKVAPGTYKLQISFLGYESKSFSIQVKDKNDDQELGVIKLKPTEKVLQEVVVEGQKTFIEEKVDRTVYNAERDATNKGGDATDVLKKVPMLSVDMDGNPSLRGSSNIKVLINNKPSTILATSITDALKQIPADMIKTVEVITSPSARYDAEGSAGIINITTKKNTLQGLTLNINSSAGIRGSNLGLNGNFRNKNWGLSLGGFGRSEYNVLGSFESTQITTNPNGSKTTNIQTSDSRRQGLFGNYQLGFDWDINKYNSITSSIRFGVRNGNNWQDGLKQVRNNVPTSLRNTNSIDQSTNVDINVDYTRTFEKAQKEFSILSMYSKNNRANDFYNDIMNPLSSMSQIMSSIRNENTSYNEEMTFQMDYQTPITKMQLVEVGVKGIGRNVTSDYKSFRNPNGNNESGYVPVTGPEAQILPTNVFDYTQNIVGAYANYTLTTKSKWSVKAGGRYEYTDITASFLKKEGQNLSIPPYGVFVPSVNFSKTFRKGTWRFSYNRRIQRPGIQNLNPNVNATNPLNISVGNPNLAPEYTANYEVNYSRYVKQTYISSALFVRNTTGAISQIRTVIGDMVKTRAVNIGSEQSYGMNFNLNINVSNKLMIGGGGDLSYVFITNNNPDPLLNAKNEGLTSNFRIFSNYNIGGGWGLQLFSFYRPNQIMLQGSQGGFGMYNLSVRKDLKNKKGSFGIGAENFLTNGITIRNETNSPVISQVSYNTMRNMNFRVNFTYNIGKMTFGPQKKKKSVNNDDTKDGDSAPAAPQPMQMGPGMGGGMRGGGGFGGGPR